VRGRTAAAASAAVWAYLAVGHGRFWRTSVELPPPARPAGWPSVVAVVPARNEADVLPETLPTLVAQDYPGEFRVLVVDDDSSDGTGTLATALGADVMRGSGPPVGWAGKVAAMATGVAAAGRPDYLLFTDADIAYPPDAVRRLVTAAGDHVLTSQMVRLRAGTRWEKAIVPAFVYFFAQLYPFARVNGPGRVAAAAGGCMLVRRDALEAAGGLARIRDALIDDVALGRLLKPRGRIWLGLSSTIRSVRQYPRLADLWDMVARSAYTQLRYSPVLLAGTLAGLGFVYLVPPAALVAGAVGGDAVLAALGGVAWATMSATYAPMLRFYGLSPWRAPALPAVAVLYAGMTADSARRHRAGRGGLWKGRVRPQ
jgi:hopene-associated glycosyltransferase HpnB